jgi:Sec-independent protein secretion pathway component TatC
MKLKLIIAILFLMLPVFYLIYAVVAESMKERREAKEAKKKGITIDTGKPKYTYSVWSVLSGILIAIPVLIYELFFKRPKRY